MMCTIPPWRDRWTFFNSLLHALDFLHNKRLAAKADAAAFDPHTGHGDIFPVRPDNVGQFLNVPDVFNAELIIKRDAAGGVNNQHNLAAVKRMLERGAAEADMRLDEFFKTMGPVIFLNLELSGFLRKI